MADVFVRRWYSLAAAVLLELLAGLNALFSLYAHELRDNLGYSQPQLQGLGTATVSAGLLAVVPGFLLVYLADRPRLGPRLVVWTGIAFSCIGYLLVWAGADGKIAMPFGLMVVLSMLISDGSSWVDTAATTVSLDNFPHHKGYITGLVKACRCLGAPIITMVYSAFQSIHGVRFILFAGVFFSIISMVASLLLNKVPFPENLARGRLGPDEKLQIVTICVIALSVWQLVVALVDSQVKVGSTYSLWTMTVAWVFFASVLGVLMWDAGNLVSSKAESEEQEAHTDAEYQSVPSEVDEANHDQPGPSGGSSFSEIMRNNAPSRVSYEDCDEGCRVSYESEPSRAFLENNDEQSRVSFEDCEYCPPRRSAQFKDFQGYKQPGPEGVETLSDSDDTTLMLELEALNAWQCLRSLRFWILWISQFVTNGIGFTLLANIGSHLEALSGTAEGQQTYILSNTASKAAACVLVGSLSEWLLQEYDVPRLIWIVGAAFGNCITFLCLGISSQGALLTLVVVQGLLFGATWGITPACTYELLGRKYFAAIQGYMQLATACGTVLFNTLLAGFNAQIKSSQHGDPRGHCFGKDCYRNTYFTIAAVSFAQGVLCAILVYWTQSRHHPARRTLSGRTRASSVRPVPVMV